jgi:transcriptional regulator with XRE-family HTH domain
MSEKHQVEQGKRLKEMRKFLRVNQQELAQALEVTQPFLSSIENGKSALSRNLLTNISNGYPQINTNWLLTGAGEMLLPAFDENKSALSISEANEQQIDYANPQEEMAHLRRRVKNIEQFVAKKFPDFNADEI